MIDDWRKEDQRYWHRFIYIDSYRCELYQQIIPFRCAQQNITHYVAVFIRKRGEISPWIVHSALSVILLRSHETVFFIRSHRILRDRRECRMKTRDFLADFLTWKLSNNFFDARIVARQSVTKVMPINSRMMHRMPSRLTPAATKDPRTNTKLRMTMNSLWWCASFKTAFENPHKHTPKKSLYIHMCMNVKCLTRCYVHRWSEWGTETKEGWNERETIAWQHNIYDIKYTR